MARGLIENNSATKTRAFADSFAEKLPLLQVIRENQVFIFSLRVWRSFGFLRPYNPGI